MTTLPTTPGSVVQADSLLMLTRWGNWVSDGVFTISATELSDEPWTLIFDAARPTTRQIVALAVEQLTGFGGNLEGAITDLARDIDEGRIPSRAGGDS